MIVVPAECLSPTVYAENSDVTWRPVRKSDGATTHGGYWYGHCPDCRYESESHWKYQAKASLTKHYQGAHVTRVARSTDRDPTPGAAPATPPAQHSDTGPGQPRR